MIKSINEIVKLQKDFFNSGVTRDVKYRIEVLKKLKSTIKKYENELCVAIKKDNNKSKTETLMTEILPVLDEIEYMIKNIKKLSRVKKVKSSIYNFKAKSYIYPKPYGVVLNISSWNFPINLSLIPLVGAIAAGNTCILKVSEFSSNVAIILRKLLKEVFAEKYVVVLNGDKEQVKELLEQKIDYVFFTGSNKVGKLIMKQASENLIPITLELGGKSPCLVTEHADLNLAARRIVWGKYLNAGQVCVAPDYVLIKEEMYDEFILKCKENIQKNYYMNNKISKNYPHIITKNHFQRLNGLLQDQEIVVGGKVDEKNLVIEPTIIKVKNTKNKIMKEEIFGPIMPIITYKNIEEVNDIISSIKEPLSAYLFSDNKKEQEEFISNNLAGSMAINDCITQIINTNLPFGGVLNSGIGRYHGKYSFETFSHKMSVMKKISKVDIPFKYTSNAQTERLLKNLIKIMYK